MLMELRNADQRVKGGWATFLSPLSESHGYAECDRAPPVRKPG
jgi:hypothetical protein